MLHLFARKYSVASIFGVDIIGFIWPTHARSTLVLSLKRFKRVSLWLGNSLSKVDGRIWSSEHTSPRLCNYCGYSNIQAILTAFHLACKIYCEFYFIELSCCFVLRVTENRWRQHWWLLIFCRNVHLNTLEFYHFTVFSNSNISGNSESLKSMASVGSYQWETNKMDRLRKKHEQFGDQHVHTHRPIRLIWFENVHGRSVTMHAADVKSAEGAAFKPLNCMSSSGIF